MMAQSAPQMMPQQQPSGGHPGGLVGVIAGEERAKAARRGSPNPATGAFNTPLPSNMPQMPGMPGMNRTMTMGSMQMPQVYTPSGMGPNGMMMPQMPMTPGGMPGMPMMPQMPMMPNPQQQSNDQMQQFMQMQMQLMQNMMAMQQAQMGQTPPPQSQQAPDYLSAGMNGRRQSIVSQAPSMRGPAANQGRSMTMMHPPTRWDLPQGGPRPNSAMPTTYAPSGMNTNHDGPGAAYSPSIAPSERSNIGMPSRYRPVNMGNDGTGRSQTMTSANTLSVYGNLNVPTNGMARPQSQHQNKSTVKLVDQTKSLPKVPRKPVPADEDEDEGWAEMTKKRDDKKRFRFGRKDKKEETSLGELYHGYS